MSRTQQSQHHQQQQHTAKHHSADRQREGESKYILFKREYVRYNVLLKIEQQASMV